MYSAPFFFEIRSKPARPLICVKRTFVAKDMLDMTISTAKHYKATLRRILFIITLLLLSSGISSCVITMGNHLKTLEVKPSEVAGTYSLLLYGCRYFDDIETVAILDKEGDPFAIELYTPDFRYTVKTGLSAAEALKEAEQFVKCSPHYQQSQFSKITDRAGNIIGYEMRPLYSPLRFGMYDVLDIQYFSKGSKIIVYIRLDPAVKKELMDDDDRGSK